jgi:hypothetical protein
LETARQCTFDDRPEIGGVGHVRRLAGVLSLNSGFVLSLLIADRLMLEQRGDFSIFRNIHEEGLAV